MTELHAVDNAFTLIAAMLSMPVLGLVGIAIFFVVGKGIIK